MMDQPEIARIRSLLLEATDAIDRARLISATLDVDDQTMLATSLDEISSALHFLQKLYLRNPGLAEEGAPWNSLPMYS
jgi:hypothetical protein